VGLGPQANDFYWAKAAVEVFFSETLKVRLMRISYQAAIIEVVMRVAGETYRLWTWSNHDESRWTQPVD